MNNNDELTIRKQGKIWGAMLSRQGIEAQLDKKISLDDAFKAFNLLMKIPSFEPQSQHEWKTLLLTSKIRSEDYFALFPPHLLDKARENDTRLQLDTWLGENRYLLVKIYLITTNRSLSSNAEQLTTHAIKNSYVEAREQISANSLDRYSKNKINKPPPVWLCHAAIDQLLENKYIPQNEIEWKIFGLFNSRYPMSNEQYQYLIDNKNVIFDHNLSLGQSIFLTDEPVFLKR